MKLKKYATMKPANLIQIQISARHQKKFCVRNQKLMVRLFLMEMMLPENLTQSSRVIKSYNNKCNLTQIGVTFITFVLVNATIFLSVHQAQYLIRKNKVALIDILFKHVHQITINRISNFKRLQKLKQSDQ